MVSNSSRLNLYFNKRLKEQIQNNFHTKDIKEIEKIIYKFLESGTVEFSTIQDEIKNTELKLKQAKLTNYGYKNRIDSIKAEQYEKYNETFDTAPSRQGEKAIENYSKRDPTNEEFQQVTKFITLRKDSANPLLWNAKCDICKEGESYQTHKEAIDDMIRHLTTEHAKKVMYSR